MYFMLFAVQIWGKICEAWLFYSKILGPKLPFRLSTAAMVTSPTGKGVVIIGKVTTDQTFHNCGNFENFNPIF